jgi:hypothetical protein
VSSTLIVTNNWASGPGSLRDQIAAANSGDTIQFDPSLSGQTIPLVGSQLVINKNLTIQGLTAPDAPVTIDGQRRSRIFEVDGAQTNVTLSNLNLIDGNGLGGSARGQGGAIWNGAIVTITGCNLHDNANRVASSSPDYGGAIYNAGTLTVQNCTLHNNSAGYSSFDVNANGLGGAIYNAGTLNVSNSTLDSNVASRFTVGSGGLGGGIVNAWTASATITNSTLFGNNAGVDGSAATHGGGIYNDGTMTVTGCTVSDNRAGGDGGGIFRAFCKRV